MHTSPLKDSHLMDFFALTFNVSGLESQDFFFALVNPNAPCPGSTPICILKHSISHVWNLI